MKGNYRRITYQRIGGEEVETVVACSDTEDVQDMLDDILNCDNPPEDIECIVEGMSRGFVVLLLVELELLRRANEEHDREHGRGIPITLEDLDEPKELERMPPGHFPKGCPSCGAKVSETGFEADRLVAVFECGGVAYTEDEGRWWWSKFCAKVRP